jgi:hypothetical protein
MWNRCALYDNIESLLEMPAGSQPKVVDGMQITPFIVADSAFGLGERVMKCYEVVKPTPEQFNFNFSLIRTRRVVECAFGRWKGRFRIMSDSRLQDPQYATSVALVACALHNWCERHSASASMDRIRWVDHTPSDENVVRDRQTDLGMAGRKRDALAKYVRGVLNVQPVEYTLKAYNAMLHGPLGFEA